MGLDSETIETQADTPWKKRLFVVTALSKYLAMALFIVLPFIGFFLGIEYKNSQITRIDDVTTKIVLSDLDRVTKIQQLDGVATIAEKSGYSKEWLRKEIDFCNGKDWFCYKDLALMIQNVEVCQYASQSDRATCAWAVAREIGTVEECNYILTLYESDAINSHSLNLINDCYSNVGIRSEDIIICNQISDSAGFGEVGERVVMSERDECYLGIAEKTGDVKYCESIRDDSIVEFYNVKDYCYTVLANQKGDSMLCTYTQTGECYFFTPSEIQHQ